MPAGSGDEDERLTRPCLIFGLGDGLFEDARFNFAAFPVLVI